MSSDEPMNYMDKSWALRELQDNLTDSSTSTLSDIEVEVVEEELSSSDEQPLYCREPEQENLWATDFDLSPRRPSTPQASMSLLGQPVAFSTPQRTDSDSDAQGDVPPSAPVPQPRPVANPQWVRVAGDEPMPDLGSRFICRNPGPRDLPVRHDPIEYFKLFMSDGLISVLTRETNTYAQQMIEKKRRANTLTPRSRLSAWTPVSLEEMRRFIGLVLGMGICKRQNIEEYWSNQYFLIFPAFRQSMSLLRFQAINRALHLSCRTNVARGQPGFDPWYKVRSFVVAINNACVKHFVPGQNLSLDESMIGMKNRCGFIQYMPNKRHARYGIKKFEVVDAKTSYVIYMAMYSGMDFLAEVDAPFTQKVVLELLTKGGCLDKGHHVFTDNYYTKLPLARALLDRDTFLTGTINKISKGLPKELTSAQLGVMEPVYYRQDEVLLVGFKEKPTRKPVFLLSTAYPAGEKTVRNVRGIAKTKPVVVNKYNQFMGGVDCKDHSLYHQSCTRTTRTYWKKIFYNLLDTCIHNAYVIFATQSVDMSRRAMSRQKFLLDVVQSLIVRVQPTSTPTFLEAAGAGHKLEGVPQAAGAKRVSQKVCAVCFKRAVKWCPGCNCGVHEKCYTKLEHYYRPTKSRKRPVVPEDSDSSA